MIKSATSVCAAVLVLFFGAACTVQAAYSPQATSATPAASSGRMDFKIDSSLDEVSHSYCARGVERFLPGSYYYCVARRELAKGNQAKSMASLEQAARWGSKPAQFLLGVGYYKGDNAPLDRARGLAWMALAAERKDVVYMAVLKSALAQSSDEEKVWADQLYRDMLGTYGDDVAAKRAERRYQRERDALTRNEAYGAEICIEGLNAAHMEAAKESGGNNNFCPSRQPVWQVAQQVDVYAAELFQGWAGHVTVGDLQKVSRQGK
ncbi:hypothetical protein [Dyella sp. 20L07]|uniref:hypothetical protein n=1 Tax=Dyella sp. 20L07 TaxID=3384240 RepID=UPI003D2CEFEC